MTDTESSPARSGPPAEGINRVVRLTARPGEVRAVVEDDFHHFRVALQHDGAVVTGVRTTALRQPFSLCAAAGDRLQLLIGTPLTAEASALFQRFDALMQCTHQFDLAALAVAMAARKDSVRRYDAFVPDTRSGDRIATLDRDGVRVLAWSISGRTITAPELFAERSLGAGFTAWVSATLSTELAEAALVLRRAVFISGGRGRADELDRMPHAPPRGGCWVQQPGTAENAIRQVGSTQDFSFRREQLTTDDEGWLAFSTPSKTARTRL